MNKYKLEEIFKLDDKLINRAEEIKDSFMKIDNYDIDLETLRSEMWNEIENDFIMNVIRIEMEEKVQEYGDNFIDDALEYLPEREARKEIEELKDKINDLEEYQYELDKRIRDIERRPITSEYDTIILPLPFRI